MEIISWNHEFGMKFLYNPSVAHVFKMAKSIYVVKKVHFKQQKIRSS